MPSLTNAGRYRDHKHCLQLVMRAYVGRIPHRHTHALADIGTHVNHCTSGQSWLPTERPFTARWEEQAVRLPTRNREVGCDPKDEQVAADAHFGKDAARRLLVLPRFYGTQGDTRMVGINS